VDIVEEVRRRFSFQAVNRFMLCQMCFDSLFVLKWHVRLVVVSFRLQSAADGILTFFLDKALPKTAAVVSQKHAATTRLTGVCFGVNPEFWERVVL